MIVQRFMRWLVGVPLAVIGIAFAVANRRWTTLSFDPFSQDAPSAALDMPLWLLMFLGMFLGMLMGGFVAWWGQGKWRKLARDSRSEIARLQDELTLLRHEAKAQGSDNRTIVSFGDDAA